jgi:cell division protein FtsW
MNTRTFVNFDMATPSRQAAAPRKATRLHIDLPLLLVVITLLVFGMLMVYSASADFSFEVHGSATYIFKRQAAFLGLGLAAAVLMAWMNYHRWRRLVVLAMAAVTAALVIVLFIGDERHGAVRTLFNGSIQPSELAKIVTVLYLAVWLYAKRDQLSDINFGLIPLSVILGFVGGLIFVQPDLSAVLTIILMGGILFFLAGGDLRQISIVMLLGTFVGWIVVLSGGATGTGAARIQSFLAGIKDPLQASYHVQRALEAFVNGGWIGVGIGNAHTKLTGLPVPHTDSIFAVVGEETGVIGSATLVILYGLLLWRGLVIARRAPDGLGRLMAAGISIWLVMEAYINMAVMVGLMPFAGNALPFISVGGSNLVVSMAAIGILMNISRLSEQTAETEERTFSEVVDLRWRERRRREPRARRVACAGSRRQTTAGQ